MRRTFFYFTLLITFCAIHIYPDKGIAEERPIGRVIAIIGSAEYIPGSSSDLVSEGPAGTIKKVSFSPWENVRLKQNIYPSDEFRTGRTSRLRILFEDNSLMALGPNTQLKISSYMYDPEYNLRQGVIDIAHGLSMYIINKEQVHPDSHFKIVTPAANMAARGTHGYISVSSVKTLIANQAGFIRVFNSDPTVVGDVRVGPMMKTIIEQGHPPTDPTPFTESEKHLIQQVVMGWVGSRYREKPRKGSDIEEALKEESELFEEDESDPCTSG